MRMLLLMLAMLTLDACAAGSKKPNYAVQARKDQDKLWRMCQDSEVSNPIGKVCSRYCVERKSKKKYSPCKKWNTKIKDLTGKEDFLFFRNGSFILIDEDNL